MPIDLRAWALHCAVFQLARDSGLQGFHVECKQGPEGETLIVLALADKRGALLADLGVAKEPRKR